MDQLQSGAAKASHMLTAPMPLRLNVFSDQIVDQLQDRAVSASHVLKRILDINKDGKIDWKDAQVLDASI